MGLEDVFVGGRKFGEGRVRDVKAVDAELRSVAALCRAARERGDPPSLMDVVDALLDERSELTRSTVKTPAA
jgi:hypothetical protein